MKTREDFVSNSSSCSFIVSDCKQLANALKSLDAFNDCSWTYGLKIRFMVSSTEENKKAFSKFLDQYSYTDTAGKIYASGDFEYFFSIDPALYSQMEDVSIYAYDDCDQNDIVKLAFLYMALKAKGIDVSDEHTEKDFNLFYQLGIPDKLVKSAIKQYFNEIQAKQ